MSPRNARQEFIEHTRGKLVLCAFILRDKKEANKLVQLFLLKKNFTDSDYVKFLKQLDFVYNVKTFPEEIHGTIWYADGSWSVRSGYFCSGWWRHHSVPEIPKELF